jgi:hypothetical protein
MMEQWVIKGHGILKQWELGRMGYKRENSFSALFLNPVFHYSTIPAFQCIFYP